MCTYFPVSMEERDGQHMGVVTKALVKWVPPCSMIRRVLFIACIDPGGGREGGEEESQRGRERESERDRERDREKEKEREKRGRERWSKSRRERGRQRVRDRERETVIQSTSIPAAVSQISPQGQTAHSLFYTIEQR